MGRVFQLGLVSVGLLALASAAGCQPAETGTNSGGSGAQGGAGAQGGGGSGAQGGGGSGAQGGGGSGAQGGGANGGGTGGVDPCSDGANAATVYDVNKGLIGADIKVKIDGVIAMSKKTLISYSKTNMDCLWGVFVSAPMTADGQQITETEAYSGTIVLSKGGGGTNPIADKAACRTDPAAMDDAIPDDVKPGDVLNVVGVKELFLLDFLANDPCGSKPTDTDIKTVQIADSCKAEKVGTAAVPTPHEFTADEIALFAEQHKTVAGAEEFKRMWGNTKIKVVDWKPELWPPSGGGPGGVTGPFGIIRIAPSLAEIHDGIYYKNGSAEVCDTAPKFTNTSIQFDYVQGFHYLDYCTWAISNDDKCADFAPQSEDCASAAITSCAAQ